MLDSLAWPLGSFFYKYYSDDLSLCWLYRLTQTYTSVHIYIYILHIRLVKRAGFWHHQLMYSALFYGRLFDISINILSMCFTKTSEICPMSWRNRFCSSSLSKNLSYRHHPLSLLFKCPVSCINCQQIGKLLSCSALSIYSVVQLSPGALEAHATVSLVYSINVIDLICPFPFPILLTLLSGLSVLLKVLFCSLVFMCSQWRTGLAWTRVSCDQN